jgi:hypothetical protein
MSGQSAAISVVTSAASPDERTPDLALQGLVLLAQFHGIAADATQLAHEFGRNGERFDDADLLLAAKQLGLKAKIIAQPISRLGMASLPALALVPDGTAFIVAKVHGEQVLIHDLVEKRPRTISSAELESRYAGRLLQVASRASVLGELAKFDFSWFVPAVVKYRKLLLEVFIVSLFIQLFALVTPLFFQVVMDKVLVHRGLTTLNVIAIGLVSMAVFEIVLTGLRTYVFTHTTSKIDVELGARLFRHVLALKDFFTVIEDLDYFIKEVAAIGDAVAAKRRSPKRIMLSLDEWNVWYKAHSPADLRKPGWPKAPPLIEEIYNFEDALIVGGALITMINNADRVKAACLAQLVNVIGPIMTETGGAAWRQTIFHPFAQASRYARGQVLRAKVQTETFSTKTHPDAALLLSSVIHDEETGAVTILALNRSTTDEMQLDVELRGLGEGRKVSLASELHHADLKAINSKTAPNAVSPRERTDVSIAKGVVSARLKPLSWNVIVTMPA